MYVEPETFDLHITFLKKHFVIVPLAALGSSGGIEKPSPRGRRVCALTFDDGWRDFYQYAFPVLKSHQVPVTVFLPTDFVGTDRWFWTDRLGFLLLQSGRRSRAEERYCGPLLNQLQVLRGSYEEKLEKSISLLKSLRNEEIEKTITTMAAALGVEAEPASRAFLDWEEVKELAGSGLVSFGSHTAGHRILTTLTEEEAALELSRSRDILVSQKVVDPSFIPFCYPNGNYTDRLTEMVREVGYDLAVSTLNGWNRWGENRFALKRVAIHQDMASTEAMFGSRLVNIF